MFQKEYTPTYRGFDSFYGYYNENMDYWDHTCSVDYTLTDSKNQFWGLDWHYDENGSMDIVWDEFGYYSTDLITDRAVKILNNYTDSEQPLFLYLAYQSVHSGNQDMPLEAPAEDVNQFPDIYDQRRRFQAGMIYNLDRHLGRVFDTLEKNKYLENSLVVFLTDNGGPIGGCDFSWSSNYPLRGSKHTLWEGGVRGVTFAYAPNFANLGSISNELFHVTDWVPTVLEAAGVPIPDGLDGVNQYRTLVDGDHTTRVEALLNLDQKSNYSAVRSGDFKMIIGQFGNGYGGCSNADAWYSPPGDTPDSSYTNKNPTVKCSKPPRFGHLCASEKFGTACMYNIAEDPCEYNNLIDDSAYADVRAALFQRLEYYLSTAVPVNWPLTDPTSAPSLHNWTWVPWVKSGDERQTEFMKLTPVF
jgi:hypothetical protein